MRNSLNFLVDLLNAVSLKPIKKNYGRIHDDKNLLSKINEF